MQDCAQRGFVAGRIVGSRKTRWIGGLSREIVDSPRTIVPSTSSAQSVTFSSVEGRTRPRTASTSAGLDHRLLETAGDLSKCGDEEIAERVAAELRTFLVEPILESLPTVDSASASATRQLRMSPGAGMSNSLRIRPVLPPSSATVTIAVIPTSTFCRPRSSVESPVPPPIATMFMAGRTGPKRCAATIRADPLACLAGCHERDRRANASAAGCESKRIGIADETRMISSR